jgi:hypothetical protein
MPGREAPNVAPTKWGPDPMSCPLPDADHEVTMEAVHVLTPHVQRPAPMPVDAPPVGPAKARRLRLHQLREQLRRPEAQVDVDAVATAIVRRAQFTRELAAELAGESARERR